MILLLTIEGGLSDKASYAVPAGHAVRMGRAEPADFVVASDSAMSRVHFEVRNEGSACWLSDLGSTNGTFLNEGAIRSAQLRDGDVIIAGKTRLLVRFDTDRKTPQAAPDAAVRSYERLLATITTHFHPLYAVLDCASDPDILPMLRSSGAYYRCLFQDDSAAALAQFSPYFVMLSHGSPLLEQLVRAGWGKAWGILLSSNADPGSLCAFFANLLIASLPDNKTAMLRFYDPRVFKMLALSSSLYQLHQLFQVVSVYLIEDSESSSTVGFSFSQQGLQQFLIPLDETKPITNTTLTPQSVTAYENAPPYRLSLRPDQMQQLAEREHDALPDLLMEDVRTFCPEKLQHIGEPQMKAIIQHACLRAPKYGIQDRQDIFQYVLVMLNAGMRFDENRDLSWARRILGMRLAPKEKVNRLLAASKNEPAAPIQQTRMLPIIPKNISSLIAEVTAKKVD